MDSGSRLRWAGEGCRFVVGLLVTALLHCEIGRHT
jgi:hypothetical protein